MPHEHEGDVRHDHPGGDATHTHDAETRTAPRRGFFGRERRDYDERVDYPRGEYVYGYRVRGGFSFGSILTGVAVALGAVLLLTALIGGFVAAVGIDGAQAEEVTQLGWGAAIGLIVAQLLAYLWGGYTAGRMARGLGWLNGLLVPITAILLAVLIGLLVRVAGPDTAVVVPFGGADVPVGIDVEQFRTIGFVAAIGSLVAMFLGGIFGGMLGARWHDKLEARHGVEEPRVRAA